MIKNDITIRVTVADKDLDQAVQLTKELYKLVSEKVGTNSLPSVVLSSYDDLT